MSDVTEIKAVIYEEFQIELDSIPSSGYIWRLAAHPPEVTLVNQTMVGQSKSIGGMATQTFILAASGEGSFTLIFELRREWEKTALDKKQFEISVLPK